MANSTVYALDAGGNKIETLTKEQILAAIQAAVETGQIPETLAAAIESVIEQNTSASIKFWVGTQAQFLELASTEENTLYFITDLTTVKDISDALDNLTKGLSEGSITVKKATEAEKATEVTGKINGKNISDIFESDGVTAKKATEVTGKINGKNISDIFETDGVTAKKATNDANGLNIAENYLLKKDKFTTISASVGTANRTIGENLSLGTFPEGKDLSDIFAVSITINEHNYFCHTIDSSGGNGRAYGTCTHANYGVGGGLTIGNVVLTFNGTTTRYMQISSILEIKFSSESFTFSMEKAASSLGHSVGRVSNIMVYLR